MKHIKQLQPILIFLLMSMVASAQTQAPKISFKHMVYDFGDVKEDGGKVTTTFEFHNLGSQPLMIKNVTSSCGCTTPSYPKQPVLPGKSGDIVAVFDPINRPGRFVKEIMVNTNADNSALVLTIKGNVVPKEPTIADKYPYQFNDLRLNKSHVSFLKMDKSEIKENTVSVINSSTNKPITIDFANVPKHLQISCEPKTLQPGQTGEIKLVYDASKVNDWGWVLDGIFVKQDGKVDYNHKLSVSVTLEENFANLSPSERAKAPKVKFDGSTFNFGSIKEGEKIKHSFMITNTGGSNLIIRKVKASCGCTATTPQKMVIAPGEESSIDMVFDSHAKSGRQYKTITVITNSPENTTTVLKIIGTVNKGT